MYWTFWESSVTQDSNRGATRYPGVIFGGIQAPTAQLSLFAD